MAVTRDDVEKIARLARLEFDENEKQILAAQMDRIVDYIQQLNELDTSEVHPTYHVLDITNVYREDNVGESLAPEKALSNAPKAKRGYFSVPKVIG